MKYLKHLPLSLALGFTLISGAHAQSDENPLDAIDELNDIINEIESIETDSGLSESLEPSDGPITEGAETTLETAEKSTETAEETVSETTTAATEEARRVDVFGNRLLPKVAPAGKENHILYTVPGAIEFRGMTFLGIDSPLFFNRFQRCDTTEDEEVYNTLARLKISQGAPLECRESMKYQFMPYKTFRASR